MGNSCKECRWWEKIEDDPECGDIGLCHHPIADVQYEIWWNKQPDYVTEELCPPNKGVGFEMPGYSRTCERQFERRQNEGQ